eukprot:1780792-Rhodomonas_salina.2
MALRVHGSRFTVDCSRFWDEGLRVTVHRSPLTVHRSGSSRGFSEALVLKFLHLIPGATEGCCELCSSQTTIRSAHKGKEHFRSADIKS